MSEEATIRRGARNARYTTVPNHVFEDVRLSMEARWLLGYLLSKPDNWTVRMGDIAKKGACGRDKARRMINELVEHGYAEKDQHREDGRFGKLALVIFDEPKEPCEINGTDQSVAFVPQTENPSTVNPSTEKPATANAALVKTEDLVIPESQSERERGRDGQEDHRAVVRAFKRAFMAWPTAISDSEPQAFDVWATLSVQERDAAVAGAERYVSASKATGRTKVCSFAVYLREHRWEKLPEVAAATAKPVSREVRPFGPAWSTLRFRALLAGPVDVGEPDVTRAKREANYQASRQMLGAAKAEATYRNMGHEIGENGELLFPADFEERVWRAHVMANGYPEAARLDKAASEGRSLPATQTFDPVAQLMEAVPVGLRVWAEWKAEFERRQWPWLPSPGKQPVVFFPAGGPEALAAFEQAIRDEGNGDDGGTRQQAAE
ncbi:helix-turn-helix domain-containing protein [Aminobacter aminovorans]|uniref:helix-turn-helix domain-containing protein n=1 Tax=Aminobacter aminovorans TaxID=83263 RepID=UPI002855AEA8|nr:helix-turn-helix domain-containing protein [Aminobacter aminovorans]MDR7220343.1 hypothetical protein [Aminobacter aminovorans]